MSRSDYLGFLIQLPFHVLSYTTSCGTADVFNFYVRVVGVVYGGLSVVSSFSV